MINRSIEQILIVTYNRVTREKTVRRAWFSESGALVVTKMSVHGWTWVYTVKSGVVVKRNYRAFDHSMAIVSDYAATFMWPGVENSDHPTTTYHRLRRVISITEEGAVTEGMYFDELQPAGPTNTAIFTRPTIGDAPYKRFVPYTPTSGVATTAITRVWDFERRRICDWDPRRDGIGVLKNVRTVRDNQPTTQERWTITPWGVGDGRTQLSAGITATDTVLVVDSIFPLPTVYPYDATIGEGFEAEDVRVLRMTNGTLEIVRGVNGTTPLIHEPDSVFQVKDVPEWQGLNVAYDWPEGRQYALELLAQRNHPMRRMTCQIVNVDDAWSTVDWGTIHTADVVTEGDEQLDGDWRVIGWAPHGPNGTMELLLEEYVP
jgi:hypothetical protein